jgi:hypothetical protein
MASTFCPRSGSQMTTCRVGRRGRNDLSAMTTCRVGRRGRNDLSATLRPLGAPSFPGFHGEGRRGRNGLRCDEGWEPAWFLGSQGRRGRTPKGASGSCDPLPQGRPTFGRRSRPKGRGRGEGLLAALADGGAGRWRRWQMVGAMALLSRAFYE